MKLNKNKLLSAWDIRKTKQTNNIAKQKRKERKKNENDCNAKAHNFED